MTDVLLVKSKRVLTHTQAGKLYVHAGGFPENMPPAWLFHEEDQASASTPNSSFRTFFR